MQSQHFPHNSDVKATSSECDVSWDVALYEFNLIDWRDWLVRDLNMSKLRGLLLKWRDQDVDDVICFSAVNPICICIYLMMMSKVFDSLWILIINCLLLSKNNVIVFSHCSHFELWFLLINYDRRPFWTENPTFPDPNRKCPVLFRFQLAVWQLLNPNRPKQDCKLIRLSAE